MKSEKNMTQLKWENLSENKCPYCEHELYRDGKELRCTECYFHIEMERAGSIIEHRRRWRPTDVIPKWYLLHEDKCPLCSHYLTRGNGQYEIFKCTEENCTFKIREDRMQEIFADPTHPANKQKKEEDF